MVIRKLVVFFSAAMSLSWAQTVATQQGEIIAAPRPSTASTALLFPYVAAPFGFDTEITISNTSRDTLGSTPQSGSCTLNYYGSTGSAPPPQTSSPIDRKSTRLNSSHL